MTRMALVTGASRGIGAAIARRLAADALHVIVNYHTNREKAEQVVDDVRAAGGSAEAWGFDVRDREATTRAVEALLEREAPLEVLVNNAGVAADAPFPALEPDAWEDVTRTTLDGFYNVTRPLVMPMVRRRRGRIINISSVSGVIGNRGQVNYSAAKAGLIGATRALARELAKRRITVNAVAPGLIETDMIQDAPVEEVLKVVPMQRLGTPDEVADLVSFLASDRAGYITGQVIGVNGGLA
ncbi:MAG: 3-oxoacyl-ACP reductase FabG [Myxococcota bacterium]